MSDREFVGKAVVNGFIRFTSVSQISKFSPDEEGGCPRKWFYEYILGKKAIKTDALKEGVEYAGQLEHYLKTGEDVLTPVLRAAKHLFPRPGKDLEVEQPLGNLKLAVDLRKQGATVEEVEAAAGLCAAGIPLDGAADVRHFRQEFYDTQIGVVRREDPGMYVAYIDDLKTTSRINDHVSRGDKVYRGYAVSHEQALMKAQLLGYGVHAHNRHPEVTHARLSLVYAQKKNGFAGAKRGGLIAIEEVVRRWQTRVEPRVREMVDVAKLTDVEKTPSNPSSCDKFNHVNDKGEQVQGCAHQSYCSMPGMTLRHLLGLESTEETNMSIEEEAPPLPSESKFKNFGTCACGEDLTSDNASSPNGKLKHIGCKMAVSPPDATEPAAVDRAAPLPADVIANETDAEIKARAEKHAAEHAEKQAAAEAAKPAGEKKAGGRCPGVGKDQRVKLTNEQAAKKRYACPVCKVELKIKPSSDFSEATLPPHNMPKVNKPSEGETLEKKAETAAPVQVKEEAPPPLPVEEEEPPALPSEWVAIEEESKPVSLSLETFVYPKPKKSGAVMIDPAFIAALAETEAAMATFTQAYAKLKALLAAL